MIKRIFTPIWKTETIEKELSKLESEGWRLEKISGFRTFEFVSAKQKNTDYIIIFSPARDSRSAIHFVMHDLLTRGAIEIKGDFFNPMVRTAVFRITNNCDNTDIRALRDKELKRILKGKMILNLFLTCVILFAFFMTVFVQKKSLIYDSYSCFQTVLLSAVCLIEFISLIYNLTGLIYLKNKNRN